MAGYTSDYVSLQNVRVTFVDGLVVDITEINIKRTPTFKERRLGNRVVDRVFAYEDASIKFKGWNGVNLGFKDLIPNTAVDNLAFDADDQTAGAQDLVQSDFFDKFPPEKWVIGPLETTLNTEDPSAWDVDLVPNVKNPNPAAGGGG